MPEPNGRVPCIPPLTRAQVKIAELLAGNRSVGEVARMLGVAESTLKEQMQRAVERIPGCWPPRMRLIMWYMGCSRDALEGIETPEGHLRRAMGIGPHG